MLAVFRWRSASSRATSAAWCLLGFVGTISCSVVDSGTSASFRQPPSLGYRAPMISQLLASGMPPASATQDEVDPSCQGNGVFNCAGPGVNYPSEPGVMFASQFEVPAIPAEFTPPNSSMTYYDYFNLWYSDVPSGGYFNQFVPQLYLGGVLCNSSNAAVEEGMAYRPNDLFLDKWHLGAMYYFALCDIDAQGQYNCTSTNFNSRAATGKLVPVEPGEFVWTRFVLSPDWVWTLSMGVVGGGPDRESYVTVQKPFMGLLESTSSWEEERYRYVGVGACQENYNMVPGSIPAPWEVTFSVTALRPADFWRPWTEFVEARCPWAPKGRVSSAIAKDNRSQTARWEISMQDTVASAVDGIPWELQVV